MGLSSCSLYLSKISLLLPIVQSLKTFICFVSVCSYLKWEGKLCTSYSVVARNTNHHVISILWNVSFPDVAERKGLFSLRCHCLIVQCKLVPPITLAFSSSFFYVRALKTVCKYTYFCVAYFLSPPIDYKLHEGKTLPVA